MSGRNHANHNTRRALNSGRVCFLAYATTTSTQAKHFAYDMWDLFHSQSLDGVRQWVAEGFHLSSIGIRKSAVPPAQNLVLFL
jgi:hypothetical protein